MVLAAPDPLLTPPPSSSPPKTPFRSYSAQIRSQMGTLLSERLMQHLTSFLHMLNQLQGMGGSHSCVSRWPGCGPCPRLGFAARGRWGPSPGVLRGRGPGWGGGAWRPAPWGQVWPAAHGCPGQLPGFDRPPRLEFAALGPCGQSWGVLSLTSTLGGDTLRERVHRGGAGRRTASW
jgi:hypothetical protein